MGRAEVRLREELPEPATLRQDEALILLDNALARLQEISRQTADEALQHSLEQIREDLDEILVAQLGVNMGIGKLLAATPHGGRIRRLQARSASKLARRQADIRIMVEAQVQDFRKVRVYEWALKRVAKWMDDSRRRLTNRRIDVELVTVTDRIARELQKLINAIVETQSLPLDTEFVESEHGGGGRGEINDHQPVPTVAELLVLKAMQADINDRTLKMHDFLDPDQATEEQLRELTMLGEDQAEVRRLTEMVTRRER